MSNSSFCHIDRSLLGATTPGQSEPGSDVNEGILCISQSTTITGAPQSDCLVSYQDTDWRWEVPFSRDAVSVFYSHSRLGWEV